MTKNVLLKSGQTPIYASDVADTVGRMGFRAAAAHYGLGESTIRKFLADEGYRFKRSQTWQVEHLPGIGEPDEQPTSDAPATGADERAGAGTGLDGVEGSSL